MATTFPVFFGIDVGTSGIRCLAVNVHGEPLAIESVDFAARPVQSSAGYHEQNPDVWWQSVCLATGRVMDQLKRLGVPPDALQGSAVDGTSGTIVGLDGAGKPIRPALMYNDPRGVEQAEQLNSIAHEFLTRHGYRFSSSFAAAKILWFKDNEPLAFDQTACFSHQSDYIVSQLTGEGIVTDFNNALKTGYDLLDNCWPDWLRSQLGLGDRLPAVVEPGALVGRVSASGAEQSGLPAGLPVMAGTTDGVAACLASGLRRTGDYNTTLGTTLVFKGLSDRISTSPGGLVYSHRLPGGRWLPGAASNTGAEWIGLGFADADLASMDRLAEELVPAAPVAYPLARQGERFPFAESRAEGFFARKPGSEAERYASSMLGTALVERLAYKVLDGVTEQTGNAVYATGGGSRSDIWTQLRADVTGRTVHRPAVAESVFGAALLAASGALGEPLGAVIKRMVRIEKSFFPNVSRAALYEERFEEFGTELRSRGYL